VSTGAAALREAFGPGRVRTGAPLAPLTTFKLGGPADVLLEAESVADIRRAVEIARDFWMPVSVLGGGSNILVADAGVRGLVIRVRRGAVCAIGEGLVRADAGVTINGLVRWTIGRGLASLEAWAGTPGTVGGALYGNAHFHGRNIGDLVAGASVLAADGRVQELEPGEMEFGYDSSRLQRTGEVVLSADFLVTRGNPELLRETARTSLAYRKRTQPLASPSAGCIFQNPDPARDRVPEGIPWSAGALVDRAGLKGLQEGGARVSPTHANFIVNEGTADAQSVRRLIERCKAVVLERFGVHLREEIVYLGFEGQPVSRSIAAEG